MPWEDATLRYEKRRAEESGGAMTMDLHEYELVPDLP